MDGERWQEDCLTKKQVEVTQKVNVENSSNPGTVYKLTTANLCSDQHCLTTSPHLGIRNSILISTVSQQVVNKEQSSGTWHKALTFK